MAFQSSLSLLQPDLVLHGSILSLTPAMIEQYGLKGLVLDVDETLVPTRERSVAPELLEWLAAMKQVVPLWLVSNNINRVRIGQIAETLDLPYILGAGKPSRRKLRQAVMAMDLPPYQVAMVGDRFFTDVLAGNRLGMFTILVEPMVNAAQEVRHDPLRSLEVWVSQLLGASLQSKE
jgi:uncharacterized protein